MCTRKGKEKVIHVCSNDGHAHKILHHQTREREEGGREENRRKGRSASSTCILSSCAIEEKIERCCAHSRFLLHVCARFIIVVLEKEVRVFSSLSSYSMSFT